MNLEYAVERLYEAGWTPMDDADLERLGDGRLFPSVLSVQRNFARVEHQRAARGAEGQERCDELPDHAGTLLRPSAERQEIWLLSSWPALDRMTRRR